jgi:hypothetical protein
MEYIFKKPVLVTNLVAKFGNPDRIVEEIPLMQWGNTDMMVVGIEGVEGVSTAEAYDYGGVRLIVKDGKVELLLCSKTLSFK